MATRDLADTIRLPVLRLDLSLPKLKQPPPARGTVSSADTGVNRKMRLLGLLILAMLLSISRVNAAPVTITFDEAGIPDPTTSVTPNVVDVAQIGDAMFDHLRVYDASNLYSHINLSVSPFNAAYFGPLEAVTMRLADGQHFDLVSAYFGSTHGAGFTLNGWRDGQIVYSGGAGSTPLVSTITAFNWSDIDMLTIQSTYFLTGYNMMDNLTYSVARNTVPEPSTAALLVACLLALAVAWRIEAYLVRL